MKYKKTYCSILAFLLTGLIVFCQSSKSQTLKKNKSVKTKLSKQTIDNQNNLSIELDENPRLRKSEFDYSNPVSSISENENLNCNIFSINVDWYYDGGNCEEDCSKYIRIYFDYTGGPFEIEHMQVFINGVALTIDEIIKGEIDFTVFGCYNFVTEFFDYYSIIIEINDVQCESICSNEFEESIFLLGCTDPSAVNFACYALEDDGSCIFYEPCDIFSVSELTLDPDITCTVNGNCDKYVSISFEYTGIPFETNDITIFISSETETTQLVIDKIEFFEEMTYKVSGCHGALPEFYILIIEISDPQTEDFCSYTSTGSGLVGCTDPSAINFDCYASVDNESCIYEQNINCDNFSITELRLVDNEICEGNCNKYVALDFYYEGAAIEALDINVYIYSRNNATSNPIINQLAISEIFRDVDGELTLYKVFGCYDFLPEHAHTYSVEISNDVIGCTLQYPEYLFLDTCDPPEENCGPLKITSNANTLTYKDLWSLSINNDHDATAFNGRIEVQVTRLSTDPSEVVYIGKTGDLSFAPGTTNFNELNYSTLGDIDNSATPDVNNQVLQALLQTGSAIAGEYQIQVFLYDSEGESLCDEDFKNIVVDSDFSPPFLMFPFYGDSIDYPLPFFQWEASSPLEDGTNLSYSFKMVELLPSQNPQHAIATNYPWHEERLYNPEETEFTYLNEARPLEALKTYVWQIVAENPENQQTAKSEVSIFTYVPPEFDETVQINYFEEYCNNLKPELRINSRMPQEYDENIDNKFKIRAAISYNSKNQIEELLPWKLSVKYEITTKDFPDFSYIGVFNIGSSRQYDTYEIFGIQNYLEIHNAQLLSKDIELRIIDSELFPKGIDLPQNICVELSIEKDKENRFTKIRDLLISKQIIPNNDAYYLFYSLNPELYDRQLTQLDGLKTPIMDEPQIALSQEAIEKSQAKFQNENEDLENNYKQLEQSIANADLDQIFNNVNSSKTDSLDQVLDFINVLQSGERQMSDLSIKFLLIQVNSLMDYLEKETKLSKNEQDFVNLLMENILEMKIYNDFWRDQNTNKTGYLDEIEKEESAYAMLGSGPSLGNKSTINLPKNSSSAGTYDVKVSVETLDKKGKKYPGWIPKFIPAAYDPKKIKESNTTKFEEPSTATHSFIPVSDIKIWAIQNNKTSKTKEVKIYFEDLLSIVKSYLGAINKDWTPKQIITFYYFELIDKNNE